MKMEYYKYKGAGNLREANIDLSKMPECLNTGQHFIIKNSKTKRRAELLYPEMLKHLKDWAAEARSLYSSYGWRTSGKNRDSDWVYGVLERYHSSCNILIWELDKFIDWYEKNGSFTTALDPKWDDSLLKAEWGYERI